MAGCVRACVVKCRLTAYCVIWLLLLLLLVVVVALMRG